MFGKSITSSTAVDFSYSSNTTEYFYAEACLEPARRSRSDRRSRRDAPGTAYDNLGFFVNEILIGLAASGSGILRLPETQLIDIASGNPTYAQAITDLLNSEFDNSDITRPHAYLVWMMYDNNMTLDAASSGAAKVQNPNALETILRNHIPVAKDGYCHIYLSNGSTPHVNFDNFNVARVQGKVRQINDYYPYGMPIYGLNGDHDDYLNKYTGKEYQTGEFDPSISQGLEMMDFGSRFYDAQLARWHAPDPAEQFSNPYLAMGNTPINGTDPDGRWFGADDAVVAGIGFVMGYVSYGISNKDWGGDALAAGAISAGVSWLAYNTAGAASDLMTKSGFGQSLTRTTSQAIGGAVGGAANSTLSQLYFEGSLNLNNVGQSALYGVGHGIGTALVDNSNLYSDYFPGHHSTKYIVRSTVGEIIGGTLTGNHDNLSFGLNLGLVLPILSDAGSFALTSYASKKATALLNETLSEYDIFKIQVDAKYRVTIDYGPNSLDNGGFIYLDNQDGGYLFEDVAINIRGRILSGGFTVPEVFGRPISGLNFRDLSGLPLNVPYMKLPFSYSDAIRFSGIYSNMYRYGQP